MFKKIEARIENGNENIGQDMGALNTLLRKQLVLNNTSNYINCLRINKKCLTFYTNIFL